MALRFTQLDLKTGKGGRKIFGVRRPFFLPGVRLPHTGTIRISPLPLRIDRAYWLDSGGLAAGEADYVGRVDFSWLSMDPPLRPCQ